MENSIGVLIADNVDEITNTTLSQLFGYFGRYEPEYLYCGSNSQREKQIIEFWKKRSNESKIQVWETQYQLDRFTESTNIGKLILAETPEYIFLIRPFLIWKNQMVDWSLYPTNMLDFIVQSDYMIVKYLTYHADNLEAFIFKRRDWS